jgi:2-iminobutanoate/2-iminopropanoate deaminase
VEKQIIQTDSAPAAIGPYSQAVRSGELLLLSGQIPLDPATGALIESSIEDETRRVMDNLGAVLAEAGCSFEDVLKTTIYLTDLGNFAAVNGVYGGYLGDKPPARATVQVAALPKGARVEIDAIARVP